MVSVTSWKKYKRPQVANNKAVTESWLTVSITTSYLPWSKVCAYWKVKPFFQIRRFVIRVNILSVVFFNLRKLLFTCLLRCKGNFLSSFNPNHSPFITSWEFSILGKWCFGFPLKLWIISRVAKEKLKALQWRNRLRKKKVVLFKDLVKSLQDVLQRCLRIILEGFDSCWCSISLV